MILNRIASPAHAELLSRACFEHVSTPVLGTHPARCRLWRCPAGIWAWSRRSSIPDLGAFLTAAADLVEARLDLDRIQRLARPPSVSLLGPDTRPLPPLGQRTAVARDRAFAFAYAAVLDGWRRQGVEVLPFSPLADEAPDATARMRSFCPAAIRSCTPARSPATPPSWPACAPRPNGAPSSTANAAATWRWAAP